MVALKMKSIAKKNVVMSSEAMKEMAKQAKATRDERRTQMDARHAFLFEKLAEAIGIELTQVEDSVLGDEKTDGSRKLMFFYKKGSGRESLYSRAGTMPDSSSVTAQQAQKRLFITNGTSDPLSGMCYFFLRITPKAITTANIAQEINFSMMDCTNGKLLDGLSTLLSKVMVPALKSNELEMFVHSLSTAKDNMDGRVELSESDSLEGLLDTLKSPSDYLAAASVPDTVEKLEELCLQWCRQIEQVLAESEQMRKEADDIGPAAELDHWKKRMAKFNSLLEQVKSPRCKATVGVLHAANQRC
ncbi:putative dynein heavy chain 5, axonemal [Apostichopus japonicus]|uniref:Putative dynein heavy chain 5, axonemal n=1 Tax=Stichopus japonicus TaxID=307972 RepID=A0A2G8LFW0_STIJA|nr:putative dynein heavy chain 5, axonemal [Apostichopus japonicus]